MRIDAGMRDNVALLRVALIRGIAHVLGPQHALELRTEAGVKYTDDCVMPTTRAASALSGVTCGD